MLDLSNSNTIEKAFEDAVCNDLNDRGWTYEDQGNTATAGWDVNLALVPQDVLRWLSTQYPDEYEKAVPSDLVNGGKAAAENKLLVHITKELAKSTTMDPVSGHPVGGLLGVLRKGFTYAQVGRPAAKFGAMMAFPPANPNLISVVEASEDVVLRVLRQVRFDTGTSETLDLVLTANGIPVVTMELKTDNTQTVNHAISQYKLDRKPGRTRPLLAPGRALVHFAVSNQLVYMATKLDGESTVFLPFNQGHEGHEGNPPSNTGSATNYLWREVLARPMFMRILKDFALYEPDKKAGKKGAGRLIFPRFHQLRAVERAVADVAEQAQSGAAGGRYLIWHSAGSGKTKTIAWLSHRLIRHMGRDSSSTFDSVIVVTDRTVLDENIREDMHLVQSSKGLVVSVGEKSGAKSPQLKKALLDGNHIITCTLQTFPEVMKLIEGTSELQGRNWAVIADEAHSSQTGTTARQLRALLADTDTGASAQDDDPDEDADFSIDELLAAHDSAIAQSANITFIAFTATPKAKTLRLFGTERDGRWEAFDTYTMAQAIEEKFILDVLQNFSTYDMFLKVKNTLDDEEDDTLVDTAEAVTSIVRFARLHPTAIAQKVEIVVEHFRRNVAHMLDGTARAMVVTERRADALAWSEKMNAYIAKKGYQGLGTLVAFSGTLQNEAGDDVTEASLNGRSDTARAFREEDEYRVLIVANKFQTGFDEPRLMAMYVDKTLTGVMAVQTLSRLNRIYPGKTAPMVVDFRNKPESIKQYFQLYYEDAHVEGEVDPNAIYTLAERLDAADIYSADEMIDLSDIYLKNESSEEIQRVVGRIVAKWNGKLLQAVLRDDKVARERLEDFRSDSISYRNAWQLLSQIVDFKDPDLHRRAIMVTLLSRNLHLSPEEYDDSYMQGVQLSGVKFVPGSIQEDHSLSEGAEGGLELPGFDGQKRGEVTAVQGPLEEAIAKVNDLFSQHGVNVNGKSVAGFITTYWGFLDEDDSAVAMAQHNTVDQLKASKGFADAVGIAVFKALQESEEIRSNMTDPEMLIKLAEISAVAMHAEHQKKFSDDNVSSAQAE